MNYTGMYLGIVVQNNDPEERGRVKLYIPHISANVYKDWYQVDEDKEFAFPGKNIDSDLSTIIEPLKEVLPWAEPAMPLVGASGSGRYNSHLDQATVSDTANIKTAVPTEEVDVASKYNLNDSGIGEAPGRKYEFESMRLGDAFTDSLSGSKNAPNRVNRYSYNYKPTTYSNKSKGSFSIPNVGAHLWVFFESGDPGNPVYFAASTGEEDWAGIYKYNDENDYPATYENVSNVDDPYYDVNTETYRNKYVINQKAGSLEFVNTDNREILKMTHFSGSFKEFNNNVNIELATGNDQKLIIKDQFYTVQGFKNLFTGRDLDNIIKGDVYKKIGHLDIDLHRAWRERARIIANVKQLFEIKRCNAVLVEDDMKDMQMQTTSTLQSRAGTPAPCPVCQDPERVDKIHRMQSSMDHMMNSTYVAGSTSPKGNAGYGNAKWMEEAPARTVSSNEVHQALGEMRGSSLYTNYLIERSVSENKWDQRLVKGKILGDDCPVCGGTGLSPSSMNGEWEVEPLKASDGSSLNFDIEFQSAIKELFEIEKKLGHGGSEFIDIAKHKSETIGLIMNDFPSVRIDEVGKINRDKVVIHPEGTFNSQKASPLIEYVHVDDLPGGSYTLNVCNKWNVQVGSGGISMKTSGSVDIGGTITNIAGDQVNVGSAREVNIDGGERLSMVADIISIRQRNRGQVLVDSNLGVSQNVIIGGGLHVEGELTCNHITAPVEIQETDPVTIFGQLLEGCQWVCNINGGTHVDAANSSDNHPNWTGATITITRDSNDDRVRMYPHTHAFRNVPLNLKTDNDAVRKDAMDNNAGVRRDSKPVEAKPWDKKVYNDNITNLKQTDQSKLDTPEDFHSDSSSTDNFESP